jgi:hypothetical protein
MRKILAVLIVFFFTPSFLGLPAIANPFRGTAEAQEYGPPPPPSGSGYGPPPRDYGPPPDYGRGQSYPPPGDSGDYGSARLLSPEQLDNLLAPVALYPDPLLAHILVAATFVDQIEDAARWMRAHNDPNGIDSQPWDVSVKAVAHYPSVLYMMTDRIDWTTALGQAYVNQSTDVMASVQHLRAMAYSAGTLRTTPPYEKVVYEPDYIRIEPYQPDYIYVPAYDPAVVFVAPAFFAAPLISFGPPFPIGPFLIFNFDFRARRIINVTNIFINIRINREVIRRRVNINVLNRFTSVHRNVRFDNLARGNWNDRGNTARRDLNNPRIDPRQRSFDQRALREDRSRLAREGRMPQSSFRDNRSFDPRSNDDRQRFSRAPLPQQPPRDFRQPPQNSFRDNRSFGSRGNMLGRFGPAAAPPAPRPTREPEASRSQRERGAERPRGAQQMPGSRL